MSSRLNARRDALPAALVIALLSCSSNGDWRTDFSAFEAKYYSCASRLRCSVHESFRDASVTWRGRFLSYNPADSTVTLEMDEAEAPDDLAKVMCCFGPAKNPAAWEEMRVGQDVTFRATIGKGSQMFAVLALAGSAILYLGDLEPVGSP